MKLAAPTYSACALLMTACFAPQSTTFVHRSPGPIQYRLSESLAFAAVEPGAHDRMAGDLHYFIRWVEADSPRASLDLRVSDSNSEADFFFEIVGPQRVRVPIGQRYLDERHFSGWTIEGEIDGQAYAGPVAVDSLHLDLVDGTVYIALDVDLQPVDHSGPAYSGRIDGEGVQGSSPVACVHPEAPRGRTDADMRAEYCDPIREAIAETPDDPDAPPPPWDPDGDVIDCTEGDDCGDPIPVPPPPG